MLHRLVDVRVADGSLVVDMGVAVAGRREGLVATYRWTADGEALRLELTVTPDGRWTVPLPRLGLRMSVPGTLDTAEWYGLGPGECYVDSCAAAIVGRHSRSVEELQTPYVHPQENGNRMGVRWVELRDRAGWGPRVDGTLTFHLTVRRWTTEALDAARHTFDLVPDEVIHLILDVGHTGLGSSSCGPVVAERHRFAAAPTTLRVTFRPISPAMP